MAETWPALLVVPIDDRLCGPCLLCSGTIHNSKTETPTSSIPLFWPLDAISKFKDPSISAIAPIMSSAISDSLARLAFINHKVAGHICGGGHALMPDRGHCRVPCYFINSAIRLL